MNIIPTCDSKTRFYSGNKNTFGLLPGPLDQGGTCPAATCGKGGCIGIEDGRTLPSCYVYRTINYRPAVGGILKQNTDLLMGCQGSVRVRIFEREFARFADAWETRRRSKGDLGNIPYYRIHWSGDCPDISYAADLAQAMKSFNGKIKFWGYSRALFTVPIMAQVPNVSWYLSMDPVNVVGHMQFLHAFYPEAISRDSVEKCNISYALMDSKAPADPMFKAMVPCPSDSGKVPHAEACRQCRLCLTGKPIFFKRK